MSLPFTKPHWLGEEVRMYFFTIFLGTQVLSFPTGTQLLKKQVKAGLSHRMCLKWLF